MVVIVALQLLTLKLIGKSFNNNPFIFDIAYFFCSLLILRTFDYSLPSFKNVKFKGILLITLTTILIVQADPILNILKLYQSLSSGTIGVVFFQNEFYSNFNQNPYENSYLLFRAVILVPFFEEIIFRYFVISELMKRHNSIVAVIMSSILFSLIHMDLEQSLYAFVIGIFFGYLFVKKMNIWLIIFLHSALNIAFSFFTVEQVNFAVSNIGIFSISFLSFLTIILIFRNKYAKLIAFHNKD
jgi:membrane protease YdiL (CAAX protease family)